MRSRCAWQRSGASRRWVVGAGGWRVLFFFQAEDGIRDVAVTGVQTCALPILLMHVGCGYSLRETAVRAKAAGVAEVSDVTLLNRLRQAEGWLQHLCQQLLKENEIGRASCRERV